jgi:hypothetical protein
LLERIAWDKACLAELISGNPVPAQNFLMHIELMENCLPVIRAARAKRYPPARVIW